MKKKLLLILCGVLCCGCLFGCVKDNVNKEINNYGDNRFIDTGDIYKIEECRYTIVYDSITKIVYLSNNDEFGRSATGGLSPMYGENKLPMDIDEYNKTK